MSISLILLDAQQKKTILFKPFSKRSLFPPSLITSTIAVFYAYCVFLVDKKYIFQGPRTCTLMHRRPPAMFDPGSQEVCKHELQKHQKEWSLNLMQWAEWNLSFFNNVRILLVKGERRNLINKFKFDFLGVMANVKQFS